MADADKKEERKEEREQKEEQRKESRADRKKARAEHREERKEERAQHHEDAHKEHAEHRMEREQAHEQRHDKRILKSEDAKSIHAKAELQKTDDEMTRIISRKDIHVYDIHHWMKKLNRANKKLLYAREKSVDKEYGDTDWVTAEMQAIYKVSSELAELEKKVEKEAGGKHTLKKDAFDTAKAGDDLLNIRNEIRDIIAKVPTGV